MARIGIITLLERQSKQFNKKSHIINRRFAFICGQIGTDYYRQGLYTITIFNKLKIIACKTSTFVVTVDLFDKPTIKYQNYITSESIYFNGKRYESACLPTTLEWFLDVVNRCYKNNNPYNLLQQVVIECMLYNQI